MIGGFKHKGLRQLYENGDRSKVPQAMVVRIERVLAALDAVVSVNEV